MAKNLFSEVIWVIMKVCMSECLSEEEIQGVIAELSTSFFHHIRTDQEFLLVQIKMHYEGYLAGPLFFYHTLLLSLRIVCCVYGYMLMFFLPQIFCCFLNMVDFYLTP